MNIPFEQTYRRRVALCLGVNEYAAFPSLEYAVADAQSVGALLRSYGFDEVLVWTNGDISKDRVVNELLRLKSEAAEDDLFVFYFAGHGQTVPLPDGGERGFLIPPDCDPGRVAEQGISMGILKDIADMMPNRHTLFLVDACYSGYGLSRSARGMSVRPAADSAGELKEYVATMLSKKSAQVLVAGGKQDQAQETAGHGMFTRTVLECLSGKTPEAADGLVEASELSNYVRQRVKVESKGRQTPQYGWLYGEGDVLFVTGREQRQAAEPVRPVLPGSLGGAIAQAQPLAKAGQWTDVYRLVSSALEAADKDAARPFFDPDRDAAVRLLVQSCLRLEKFDLAKHYVWQIKRPAKATFHGDTPFSEKQRESLNRTADLLRVTPASDGLAVTVEYDSRHIGPRNIEAILRSGGVSWRCDLPSLATPPPASPPASPPRSWKEAWPIFAGRNRSQYGSWATQLGMDPSGLDQDFAAPWSSATQLLQSGRFPELVATERDVALLTPLKKIWHDHLGAAEQLALWAPSLLDLYGQEFARALPPGAIYFGGTDPGRFVVTALNEVQETPPWIVLTQNALADNLYMAAVRRQYGQLLWLPSQQDANFAFQTYVNDVQSGRTAAGAEVSVSNGQVNVSGVAGVMQINGILAKMIFDANKGTRPIFVEESYVVPWMQPYLVPAGPLMRLEPEPLATIPTDAVNENHAYWADLATRLRAIPAYGRDHAAQATFSKLRSAIGGLYVSRGLFADAEQAFTQAIELCPDAPEAHFRLADAYVQQFRFTDAQRLVESMLKTNPTNEYFATFLAQIRNLASIDIRRLELEAQMQKGGDVALALELLRIYSRMGLRQRFDGLAATLLQRSTSFPPAVRLQTATACREAGRNDWAERFQAGRTGP